MLGPAFQLVAGTPVAGCAAIPRKGHLRDRRLELTVENDMLRGMVTADRIEVPL